jgi:hypothetical protein
MIGRKRSEQVQIRPVKNRGGPRIPTRATNCCSSSTEETLDHAGEAIPDQEEISEARFYELGDLAGLMPERLSRRILTALTNTDGDAYAENGLNLPRSASPVG